MAGPSLRGREEPLGRMRDSMRHRGPDGAGLWLAPDGTVGLAHRRLAVIDLSPQAAQPMSDERAGLHIVFNGEIYNYVSLRRELRALGVDFESESDTEVLLRAYAAWGVGCLERLNGMFAFALYDAPRGQLLLARDRAGEKPLFYAHAGDALLFASELKALLQHPRIERQIDAESLEYYLAYGYVPADRCIIRGVRKLPQGHYLCYDVRRSTCSVQPYWHLPAGEQTSLGEEELAAELEHLLEDSVRLRMVADVPVGILLSGGLDSSLIAALAARANAGRVRTFNVAFPGHEQLDEAPYARLVARSVNAEHHELYVDPADGADLLPALARQVDEPVADSSIIPMYLLSRAVREHATVALGGDGGDELFGGYPHYSYLQRVERARSVVPGPMRRAVAHAAGRLPTGTRGKHQLLGLKGTFRDSLAHVNLFFDAQSRRELRGPLANGAATATPERYKASLSDGRSVLDAATRLDFRTTLVDDYLVKVDRASMLASLEVRAPFLDHRLIEFAFRLPDGLRATATARKILLRRLGQRLLPPELDLQRKQGFVIPLAQWLRGQWKPFVDELVEDIDGEILDRGAVRRLVAGHRRGLVNTQRIFAILVFELWRREYGLVSVA